MPLLKRPNSKYWWLEFEFEGARHRLSTKCRNKRDAEKFAAAYRTQLANGKVDLRVKKKRPPTFAEAVADHLAWSKLNKIESTYKKYVTASKAPVRFFGAVLVTEIDREDVEGFVKWRSGQKRKAPIRKLTLNKTAATRKQISLASVHKELGYVRILFNRLLDSRNPIVDRNPLARFAFPKDEGEKEIRVLDESEARLYLMACSQPLRDVATLMLETGMRPSEVFALQKQDINFEAGFLQITRGKTKAARRKIPMLETARAILTERCSSSESTYIFAGGRGGKADTPIVKLTNSHKAAVERSKVNPFRLYDLRHTFATNAVRAGIDLVTLKDILGHSRLDMVLHYAHPGEEHRLSAMEKIRDYRKRA